MIPRILVGTLHSGEAEFIACTAAINSQQDVEVKHLVIANLPELEAHNRLWDAWNQSRQAFELFVKVDADTVLNDSNALNRIWQLFAANERVTGAQILLLDYFTRKNIPGLNCLRNCVEVMYSTDKLFADRCKDIGHDIVLKGESVQHLAPIGFHCLTPNKLQSFHYGLHRALKGQWDKIIDTYEAWKVIHDDSRAWAIVGAMWSLKHNRNFDYTDHQLLNLVNSLELDAGLKRVMVDWCDEHFRGKT